MKSFEILPIGFDGGTDELDYKILWINATDRQQVATFLDKIKFEYQDIFQMDFIDGTLESAIDFTMYNYNQDNQ